MFLETALVFYSAVRRFGRWWRSEDVSEVSLASLGLVVSALFVELVAIAVARYGSDRLAATAAALQLVGLMLAIPAAVFAVGFSPAGHVRRRIAIANAVRSVARRWPGLGLGGCAVLVASFDLLELQRLAYFLPLVIIVWVGVVGLLLITLAGAAAILPRRYVVPLPHDVEVLSMFGLLRLPRGEAIAALSGLAVIGVSDSLSLAHAFI
jgi:hypothetical protein